MVGWSLANGVMAIGASRDYGVSSHQGFLVWAFRVDWGSFYASLNEGYQL